MASQRSSQEEAMRVSARLVPVLCCIVATAACDFEQITFGDHDFGRTGERFQPWLVTDHDTYVAYYRRDTIELDIPFTFHNRGRVAVAVPRCGPPHQPALDKLVSGEWHEVLAPVAPCWDEPLVIGVGRSQRFLVRVRAGRPHTFIEPQFRTTHVPGTYRLRWELYEYDAAAPFRVGRMLPIEHRVSDEFRIIH
jgi:hypothetical protein